MADNYLITGYWGEPHVTSENDRGINAATFGAGRFVLPVGQQFRAEYIGNNTVRIYDGKLMDNGAAAGIAVGDYVDVLIPNSSQGVNRNDLIVFQYEQDASTLIESGKFVVLQGEETAEAASDPKLTQGDLLSGEASFDQMALYRIPVSGTTISEPVPLFEVCKNIKTAGIPVAEAISADGVAYSATVPGVYELYSGLEVTIVPNMASESTAITLDINGLGAKFVRLPVSTNTAMMAQPYTESYFVDSRPVKLIYDPKYASKGSWIVVGRQLPSVHDLYGYVPVQKGGLGVDNKTTEEDKAEALENLVAIGIKDYVIAEGTSGGWNYRKWNSGLCEFYNGWLSNTPTAGTGIKYGSFTLPFTMANNTYYVGITPVKVANNNFAHDFNVSNASAGEGRTTSAVSYTYYYSSSAIYEVAFAVYVMGRWK